MIRNGREENSETEMEENKTGKETMTAIRIARFLLSILNSKKDGPPAFKVAVLCRRHQKKKKYQKGMSPADRHFPRLQTHFSRSISHSEILTPSAFPLAIRAEKKNFLCPIYFPLFFHEEMKKFHFIFFSICP